ncbi:uncharacterized protein LOC127706659 [Mytilus californianus]|uniref:uncharacterized protein LOC127706659 n=1 Tax=Mytilus californianus TaxID=6549 RepID=UPI00224762F4|nr:uncharacterized protein LOC127706659 [Mytilus californianus]
MEQSKFRPESSLNIVSIFAPTVQGWTSAGVSSCVLVCFSQTISNRTINIISVISKEGETFQRVHCCWTTTQKCFLSDWQTIRSMPASEPQMVAFYAYMSSSIPAPSIHYQLVFDIAKTNIGRGYNHYTGTFNAPIQGVYVFVWTIYTQ